MKTKLSLTVCFMLCITSLIAQTSYVKGYYISLQGKTIEGYIKNDDWNSNPDSFKFRTTIDGETQILDINAAKEFGLDNLAKYIKVKVDIDQSSDNVSTLSRTKDPVWKTETAFVKTLIEGKASLYKFEDSGLKKYLFQFDDNEIKQLVYKKYFSGGKEDVFKNNLYRRTLGEFFITCEGITYNVIAQTEYNAKDLNNLFETYNKCSNQEYTNYQSYSKKTKFNLNVKAGINSSTIVAHNQINDEVADYGNTATYRLEVEGEVVLPFNNYKWALLFGLARNGEIDAKGEKEKQFFKYNYFELTFGTKHYMFINENVKLALQAGYTFDLPISFEANTYSTTDERFKDGTAVTGSFRVGLGVHYKKFFLETTVNLDKRVLEQYSYIFITDYSSLNFVVGYSFF